MKEKFENTGNKDTRSGFGAGLHQVGKTNRDVVALCADLTGSLKMDAFAAEFPERFIQCGIAEANMIGTAAGLAVSGKIPFAGSFAEFVTGRVYDQVRQVVAYSDTNVKICASHAGITLGEDGATHQTMEDLGLMRMLPNLTVINPCDYNQTKAATIAIADYHGPVYLRFGRPSVPNFTPADQKFEIGKALRLTEGDDVTIFATGHLVWEALEAAKRLEEDGISAEVVNIHTIKPLDKKAVIESASKTGAVVTAEEHLIAGGLGELIAGLLATEKPTPVEFVAVDDLFGQSGEPSELMKEYKLDAASIVTAAKRAISRK
ncbi:1-deoxy-D-xylulose-5-phosphate synthase [bioreactor metagenome]|jgi:transketolase|uniref:1-deoxy-D-xylulose-5-phosphate synthase n=1 Tax=bioreactor metagenome TaxID=1076179 RepID=A0A644W3Y8_9ZZZZ|nr:transketolase family protein [Bacteroidales bacterium]MBP8678149.1 transketolase family protein [Bacteroidales bacterium]MBP9584477.1 transketolase family protein [Bacteroidales bacterium]MBP9978715.1 transketolase family protein [Bacteroidales bacterium]WRQ32191.1 transketolase C-terminal domain-containing protein [Bacteroidales bacterium MB20-C3-3]